VGKLVQQKSRLQKIKNQRAAKPVCSANTNMVKNASFTLIYVRTVIVSIKFLFDFLVHVNLCTVRCHSCAD